MVDTTKGSESAKIVFDLEARIVEGALPGGFRLIERVLCSEYSVSRTVVREALLKLASRGLIVIVPDAGATVVPLVESKVRDAFTFREAIESAAAEQCATRMNREETEALLACAAKFGEEYDRRARGEPSRIHDLEEEFHRSVVEGSKNDFFANSWQQARLCLFRGVRVRPEDLQQPEKREISVDDHLAIARAIASGHAEEARALMSRHLRSGRDLLIQGMKNSPGSSAFAEGFGEILKSMNTSTAPVQTTANPLAKIDRTDWSALSTAQRIKHLEIEGYVMMPDMIPVALIPKIKEELDRLPTKGTDYSDKQRGCHDVQFTDSPHCIDLVALPSMIEFLNTLLGDDLVVTSCVYAVSRPGHPGIALHTDAQPYGSAIFGMQSSSPRLIRVLYYLDDLTPEKAPFKVIPHSHLSLHADNNPYKRYLIHPEEVMVMCKAGTAAIINQSVWHANYPNTSTEDRRLLAIAYRPAWSPPIAEVPDWPADKVAQLPPATRALFRSKNTKNFDFNVPNRPANMATSAPGINSSRWDV